MRRAGPLNKKKSKKEHSEGGQKRQKRLRWSGQGGFLFVRFWCERTVSVTCVPLEKAHHWVPFHTSIVFETDNLLALTETGGVFPGSAQVNRWTCPHGGRWTAWYQCHPCCHGQMPYLASFLIYPCVLLK